MVLGSLHLVDLLVIAAFFAFVLVLGRRGPKPDRSEDGFFLANRSLGKVYQFFLNFGQGTDPQSAVSTASIVYQQGMSGVWLMLQTLFVSPYYWFMNAWFRRARLTTVADLFEDRLGSRSLARFYAIFQIITAVAIVNGFSNLIAYKISASMMVKAETAWTPAERQAVEGYRELKQLEQHAAGATELTPAEKARLDELHDANARGDLHSYISTLRPWSFYLCYTAVLGLYIVLGGMNATARTEVLQSSLTMIFSVMLIPAGIFAAGGWHTLAARVPRGMFDLLGNASSQVNGGTLIAILFVTLVAAHANINNMSAAGSARNEFAARFGAVSGTYAKRVMIILWAFTGLIAISLFQGPELLSDPDAVWGTMARRLLGPGLLGLMLAGVLAGNMSTGALHTMAISGLFVRNVYRHLRPGMSEREAVAVGRWAIVGSLAIGIVAAYVMSNAFSTVQIFLLMNVPFGAAIWMMLMWRRLTAAAVWCAVCASALVTLIAPSVVAHVPGLATHPALVVRAAAAAEGKSGDPVYFESVAHRQPGDRSSPLAGHGRFHVELFALHLAGVDVPALSASARFAARFFFSGLLPFTLLILVSWCTAAPERALVEQFYGKMKTPVGATPELEAHAMLATRAAPGRFDATKLFPRSAWEFTRWDRDDAVGFIVCCAVSGAILGALLLVLRAATPA